ncbi:hypothetical protein LQV63_16305 [Paenibacillus profundus]|uniref:Collagen-like protein n=1 Tax=Paenibacillus profundus TaxID=1173085 RepID=A0ABS8YH18_9BACL|nr:MULTISPECIES: hypothetical protein [Paenibacillus]MCE5170867.1 hypothetical protein [Paenibacillus profundus]
MTDQNQEEIKRKKIGHVAGKNGVDGSNGIDGSNGVNGIDGEGSSLGLDGDSGLNMDIQGVKLNIDVAKLIQQLISLSKLQK